MREKKRISRRHRGGRTRRGGASRPRHGASGLSPSASKGLPFGVVSVVPRTSSDANVVVQFRGKGASIEREKSSILPPPAFPLFFRLLSLPCASLVTCAHIGTARKKKART
nr:hypothetical protein [Pandoravirus massiliensis]